MGAGDITRMGPLVLAEIAGRRPGRLASAHERHAATASTGRTPAAGAPAAGRAPLPRRAATAAPRRGGPRSARGGRGGRRFFALAGLAIVAGAAWALLGNRVFVVRSVTVTGTHLLAPGQVIAAADVSLGTPLLSVDTGAVTRRVEAIGDVASATVTEDWPDHLAITVTERVPAMAVRMAGGGYDLVDPTGVIVR